MYVLMSIFMMISLKIPILRLLSRIVKIILRILLMSKERRKVNDIIERLIWNQKSKINKF
jgi:hypothetical protein